ncbi:cyclic nucleotide-binding domain-containing protein [Methylotenera sp.]|uniref:cyclic nucleotide-binding domain-containing protein n=1 Tax=Methylotenera sp. TaxID=2051956 RepID=UPI002488121B|nr:cyclic nucleotide-binding domain-containing protein [Methylotenera sp.]MDI1298230.1 cyclic nucleotide-binding domain-containing protein [Methylotenera sp.]
MMKREIMELHPDLVYLGGADQYEEEIFEIIEDIKLFEAFSLDEVRTLCQLMQCYAAPKDMTLLKEGDAGDFLILILTGTVEVTKTISVGDVKLISQVGVGATLGEMSMIDGCPRFASCVTLLPTDFAVLTRETLNDVLLQMPRLGNKLLLTLLQTMSIRLREAIVHTKTDISNGSYVASL